MRRIVLKLEYIGTAYDGWQVQPGRDTVQQRVESALRELTCEEIAVIASGRTDAGVHALGQVAHFDTGKDYPVRNFMTGANRFLPPDIRVVAAAETDESFHARFSAHEKTYEYLMYESAFERAIYLDRAVRVCEKLDIAAMREAGAAFVGTHDFASFCASGADTKTSVRTVTALTTERCGGLVRVRVTADGFLYNMVRLMVGVLVDVGRGKFDRGGVERLLSLRNKDAVRVCAPACGLYLVGVDYGEADPFAKIAHKAERPEVKNGSRRQKTETGPI